MMPLHYMRHMYMVGVFDLSPPGSPHMTNTVLLHGSKEGHVAESCCNTCVFLQVEPAAALAKSL